MSSTNSSHQVHPRNLLDELLSESSDIIIAQKRIRKSRVNANISKNTHQKFMDFVKKNHNGIIKGPYSFELERAMLFYLHFFDV